MLAERHQMRAKRTNLTLWVAAVALAAVAGTLAVRRARAQIATTIPTFTPMPTPTPRPRPTPRVFRCSCSAAGHPVIWTGSVQAPNSFFARQHAAGQCLASLGAKPTSAVVPTPGPGFAAVLPTPPPPHFNPCRQCACN